jgi:hypothetical protein
MNKQNASPKKVVVKKLRKTIGVDFDLDVLETLREMGDENDTGKGWHVRRAVAEYIAKHRAKKDTQEKENS